MNPSSSIIYPTEVESLHQQLAAANTLIQNYREETTFLGQQLEWVKTTYKELKSHVHSPSGYLEQISGLRQQLADSQKREVMLRKGFTDILTDTCEKFPGQRMMQIIGICHEALASTADLEAVKEE